MLPGQNPSEKMKLYDYPGAPNPRRVRVVAAEKNIELDYVTVDMRKREHKTPQFIQKNPSGRIPVLALDDGTCTFPDTSSLSAEQPCEGDVTGDGFVNVSDILLTLSRFNTLCE